MKLYSSLADWWPLLSSPADYAEEAVHYWEAMCAVARRPIRTVLELGSGGGNNAVHLKKRCAMTLVDLSPDMLTVSRHMNPECEHIQGDMRSVRLNRQFDAVFIHDAVMHLRTAGDLRQAMMTAFAHCAPGGAALFVPDCTRETWAPSTDHGGHDGDGRAMRYLEWTWDPDPTDTEYDVNLVYAMRQAGGELHVEHERHRWGLFPRVTWLQLLGEVGFDAAVLPARADLQVGEMFAGVRAGPSPAP